MIAVTRSEEEECISWCRAGGLESCKISIWINGRILDADQVGPRKDSQRLRGDLETRSPSRSGCFVGEEIQLSAVSSSPNNNILRVRSRTEWLSHHRIISHHINIGCCFWLLTASQVGGFSRMEYFCEALG